MSVTLDKTATRGQREQDACAAACIHCAENDGPHTRPCTYQNPCPACRAEGMEPVGPTSTPAQGV